ncbi:MAG: SH3 domain-containing protein [Treponema sp.]|nr:SH3 domain-containing protein [Treponema sp.]
MVKGSRLCILLLLGLVLSGCSRHLGWGVLLWSTEDPVIPAGTVLPVYIRSNIDQVWVAGIPKEYQTPENSANKFEIPLWQFELVGRRGAAAKRAASYAGYAAVYAETLQDGLPIREDPDNTARRVYRLRHSQIVKILARAEGNPAISATGDPLPGEWYQVLTEDGITGYCFSYRLKLFEYGSGSPAEMAEAAPLQQEDPDLDRVLSTAWSPEWYGTMVSSGKFDLEDLEKQWRFVPGEDSGMAHLYLPGIDKTYPYTGIESAGGRSWRFTGAPLEMSLRSDTLLAVQYNDAAGAVKTQLFTALPSMVNDLVIQETERRSALFRNIFDQGPVFVSANYGALTLLAEEQFSWTGYDLLSGAVIPLSVLGRGSVTMGLYPDYALEDRYDGAMALNFSGIGGPAVPVYFLYIIDDQGFHIEYIPPENVEGVTVMRRSANPLVIYFFKSQYRGDAPVWSEGMF